MEIPKLAMEKLQIVSDQLGPVAERMKERGVEAAGAVSDAAGAMKDRGVEAAGAVSEAASAIREVCTALPSLQMLTHVNHTRRR